MSTSKNKSIAFGLLIGVALGVALDNVGLGIALGVVFGAGLYQSHLNKEREEQPPGEE